MEQHLDATYLRHGVFERAAAVALAAVGVGAGTLLAACGISFLWRYTPPEVAVHIANPEVRILQDGPLAIRQDKPFVLSQPDPPTIEHGEVTIKAEQPPSLATNGRRGSDAQTASGELIRREVTVFSQVRHAPGTVVTGWNYKDGSGGMPVRQFCYYTSDNPDQSSKRVDLAVDTIRRPHIGTDLVPDAEGAVSKCQWWQ
jgi:hypothetical protein